MTTFNIDNQLYQQALEVAAAQGKSVDDFVDEAVRGALSNADVRQTTRNGIPVLVVSEAVPPIDPAKVQQVIEEEGF